MANCPTCGTVVGPGATHCPQCGGVVSKAFAFGSALQSIGCLITLVVFVVVPCAVLLYACATS